MKILLIQSWLGRKEKVGPIFPLGLAYIATALDNDGHEISVLDMNLYVMPYQKLTQLLSSNSFDFVGISLRNIDTTDYLDFYYYYEEFSRLLLYIQKLKGNAKLLLGGSGFSIFPKLIMNQFPFIDYGFVGFAEAAINELVSGKKGLSQIPNLYHRDNHGNLIYTGFKSFDSTMIQSIKFPRRHFFEMQKYNHHMSIGILSKRGCNLSCVYCNYPKLTDKVVSCRSVNSVVSEIEQLIDLYQIKSFIFVDNVFNNPKAHSIEICRKMIEKNLNIHWSAWFDISKLTQENIELYAASGCYRVCISPDAVSEKAIKRMGKNHKEIDCWRVLQYANDNPNIDFRFSLLIVPGMNMLNKLKTCIYYLKANLFIRNSRCILGWIRILPDTKIFQVSPRPLANLLHSNFCRNPSSFFMFPRFLSSFHIYIWRSLIHFCEWFKRKNSDYYKKNSPKQLENK